MKIMIITAIAGAAFMVSCTQQGTAGTKKNEAQRLAEGKTIFDNSCGKCHDLPDPKAHNDQEWIGIVNAMAPKAKLTDEQGTLVYEYVSANN